MSRVLDRVSQPSDLRGLTQDEFRQLAREIRELLVNTVSCTGGHLASNLGAVELTLALHSVFDSPKDKLIWDVGHQAYVHKLLTGRKDRFSTLRQYGGLAGFPAREESEHDAFGTGHASTSISAALGMATARDLCGESFHVVAVIGDGAMTGGMAFEALNHAGHTGTRMIVVLNDNEMSISPNVGALSRSFSRLRSDPRYWRAKEGAERAVPRLPLGPQVWEAARRFKKAFKGLLIPTLLWEELGFNYLGPFDGHDVETLQLALNWAKEHRDKPTIVHVVTKKGKGYSPAEVDAIAFHGVSPSGSKVRSAPSYSKVLGQTVARLMRENPKIVAITAAMLEGTGLAPVAREFPKRVFDVGICEQHAVTFAAGLASRGMIPIVAIYSTFLQRGYDQVLHDVCMQNLPVVFALDRGGIVGDDGKSHQGTFDLSYLRTIPNIVLAASRDENELRQLVYTSVAAGRPMAIRYPRGCGLGVPLDDELVEVPIGTGVCLREGTDLALLALGVTVAPAVEAARRLSEDYGVSCSVVDARFVKPLDCELISRVAARCRRVVTIEENNLVGGFGSAVLELLSSRLDKVRVCQVGIPDEFVEHGSQERMRAKYGLDADGIVERVMAAFPSLFEPAKALSSAHAS
ncbi:MAG: 1-deoxy-D-xylulose-5-phosphate synthase [Chloroflexi bacterium]|nr:1-deoxy-D-xylulose-5-phosphate synthase [Chloroflexota bacterium]